MTPTRPITGPCLPTTSRVASFEVAHGYEWFWNDFSSGKWEPDTLAIIDHHVDANTLYLDVGSWIGPTLLYAAGCARLAVGFEPDPVAFATLEANVAANPQLKNVRIHSCAIASQAGRVTLGSQGEPGDSMSSVLFKSQGDSWEAPARRLEDMAADWPTDGPCFVKIDIEGGEFSVIPSMIAFLQNRRATVFLSLHQHFFLQSSFGRGVVSQLLGELRLFARILRFYPLLRTYPFIHDDQRRRLRPRDFLFCRRHWRTAKTLLLSHTPPPWAARA